VVCIGSLVNRTPQEALSITERVRNALPSKYELHGMGLKKSHMNSVDAFEFLDSVDSTVWNFSNMKRCGGDNQTDNWIDNLEAYVSYRNQLEAVFSQRGSSSQTFSSGFADFLSDPKEMLGDSRLPLSECQCGALVDPNAFADGREDRWITGSGCRHCERLKNRLEMAVLGHLPPKNRYSEVLDESGDEVSPS
jgi:hypothetical protein